MNRQRRSGAILIYVLVCMGIGLSLMLTSLQSVLRQRHHLQQQIRWEQSLWLLEAGYARAVAQLDQAADYQGEIWVPAVALATDDPVRVEIVVHDSSPRTIEITAEAGNPQLGERNRIRRQQTFVVPSDDSASHPPGSAGGSSSSEGRAKLILDSDQTIARSPLRALGPDSPASERLTCADTAS